MKLKLVPGRLGHEFRSKNPPNDAKTVSNNVFYSLPFGKVSMVAVFRVWESWELCCLMCKMGCVGLTDMVGFGRPDSS